MIRAVSAILSASMLCAVLAAQDAEDKLARKTARLHRACADMLQLESVRFQCKETHRANNNGKAVGSSERETEGVAAGELLTCVLDSEQIVMRGRTAKLARAGNLRSARVAALRELAAHAANGA